jgi:hypothetical protein
MDSCDNQLCLTDVLIRCVKQRCVRIKQVFLYIITNISRLIRNELFSICKINQYISSKTYYYGVLAYEIH